MQIGKEISLNYNKDSLNNGLNWPVAKYTTVVTVPTPRPTSSVEIPAVFLDGDLTTFYLYDAARDVQTALTPQAATQGAHPQSGWGGLIVATGSGAYAFGIYGVLTTADPLGSVSPDGGFQYLRSVIGGEGPPYAPESQTVSKVNALNNAGLAAGTNRFNTYLMTGTLTDVKAYMRRLYAKRVK
jgi:hypothetical protein